MGDGSIRVADLRVSRVTRIFVRYVYPLVIAWALYQRGRNQKIVVIEAEKLGAQAGQIVAEAKAGSQTLRRLTYILTVATVIITVATLVSTGFVIYSALK